ncbi:MAG: D-alanyl-D-alanine carboxypeptidase/D-alanyl-D-alanine endopeptidase [Acidimicrobiales bacterium]
MTLPRWLVPAVLVAVVLASTWEGVSHAQGAGSRGIGSQPTTPVLSARRLPVALGALVGAERLTSQLRALIDGADGTQACIEVSTMGGPVFAENANLALLPASNMKLLTAYVALAKLGPDDHLTTTLAAGQKPNGGVVDGPLYMVGGGDPLLATSALRPSQSDWTESVEPVTSLEALADRVKAAGITAVTGGVVGDDSRYDAQRTVPTWKASYVSSAQVSPVSALEVDSGLHIVGTRHVAVSDPPVAAASTFTDLLTARGVRVDGAPRAGKAPAGATTVASIDSPRMADIIGVMLRESDNLAAEMLTKELGVRFGRGGTWLAGLQVVSDALTAAHVPLDGLVQFDGSGLDRGDRLSCRTLAGVLNGPGGAAVAAALPTAGDCGTLVKRFRNSPAAGRIRAKTGSLAGVAALSGFVTASADDPPPPCPPGGGAVGPGVSFALLVNGLTSTTAATKIEDAVAIALASFPQIPVLTSLGPLA